MCGRYALGVRLAFIRHRLQQQGMAVDEAPDDEEIRETYNFAPGYNGAIYRAEIPERRYELEQADVSEAVQAKDGEGDGGSFDREQKEHYDDTKVRYKLQAMRWGLIPFWTKHQPTYGSMMKTINCRDDSLAEDRGMWTSMKKRKRCVVICQGFYEWLKKGPSGKEKIPHFVKHKDGDLMCFAGLWDCVQYEGSDERISTYAIITTDSNADLKFLHDRMPVILSPGSNMMKAWLDPHRTTWSKELQSILKPYEGQLECYPVPKDVGKVGNNSPDFIVPISSKQNKSNIANFFAMGDKNSVRLGRIGEPLETTGIPGEVDKCETKDHEWSGDKAPLLVPEGGVVDEKTTVPRGVKREYSPDEKDNIEPQIQGTKMDYSFQKTTKTVFSTPYKTRHKVAGGSTTKNETPQRGGNPKRADDGSQRITKFFKR